MATMRAVQAMDYGGSDVIATADVPLPVPGEGEALVRLEVSGVNFHDVYKRKGNYRHSTTYPNTPPFTLGIEGGGAVAEVGPGVDTVQPGDRVAYGLVAGSYAEYAAVPAWRLVKVPDGVSLAVATTLMVQGCTAHYLTRSLHRLEKGQSCLIHAGAGGVGQTVIQIAKSLGVRVFATVGSAEKADIVRALGAEAILYRDEDFSAVVLDATNGDGVNAVYDSVGRDTYGQSLKCVKRRGTLALFGGASGQVEAVSPLDLAEAGSVFLTRPHQADYMTDADEIRGRAGEMFEMVAAGTLKVPIDREYPLSDAAKAHDVLEGRETKGKVLLRITEEA